MSIRAPDTDFTFVTYRDLPDLDPDDRLAADALRRRGCRVSAAVWDDERVDWSRAGVCVIRSTWDYHLHCDAFLAWTDRVARQTRLFNSSGLIRWNASKTYLRELGERGAAVVPTIWVERGTETNIERASRERGWSRIVIKPIVGLATYAVRYFSLPGEAAAAQLHMDELRGNTGAIVQPYIESVTTYGERALVFFDGEYSHAARKTPFQPLLLAGQAGETPAEASAEERSAAEMIVKLLPESSLYARLDLVADDAGRPLVLEVELIEPTLFLSLNPASADRFADALLAVLERSSTPD